MRNVIAPVALLLAVCIPATAGAMSSNGACRIVAGEKLLAGSGGATAVCKEIERAIGEAAPKARYAAEVRALPNSRLTATLTVNGQKLPDQHFAVMDRKLDAGSIHEFARGLAEEVAKAARR